MKNQRFPDQNPFVPKHRRTVLREAEQKLLSVKREDFLDAMVVLEEGMRHFYSRAVQLKTANGNPKEIDDNLLKAVDIAEKIMPYRHHRLAAIKLDNDWPRFSSWKCWSSPVTVLPIGRCKRDEVAQFPIGLADTDWHWMRRHQAWH